MVELGGKRGEGKGILGKVRTLVTGFTVQAPEDFEDIAIAIVASELIARAIET